MTKVDGNTGSERTNAMRDVLMKADQQNAGLIMSRDQVVEMWCAEHGKSKDSLDIADILAIRALPQWQNAG